MYRYARPRHASCPSCDATHPLPLAAVNVNRLVCRSPTLKPSALLMMLIKYVALFAGVVVVAAQTCAPSDADLNTVLQITLAQSTKLLAQRAAVSCLTETDQILIRDDTTSRACLPTFCYTGITTTVTIRIISDFQPTKHRMPYSTFKYPLSNKQPCM